MTDALRTHKDDGRQAFPRAAEGDQIMTDEPGMTLRQWYAGHALAGILANYKMLMAVDRECDGNPADGAAVLARIHADALIAELDKT